MAVRIFFIAIAVALIVAAIWAYQHDQRLRANSSEINLGDSDEVVRALIGDPSRQGDCGSLTPVPKDCSSEFVYRYWYSIFQPKYEVIWFDRQGRVLGEQEVHSQF